MAGLVFCFGFLHVRARACVCVDLNVRCRRFLGKYSCYLLLVMEYLLASNFLWSELGVLVACSDIVAMYTV